MTTKTRRFTRDTLLLLVAIAWGTYEIVVGGARPAVLTLVGGVLLSPAVIRVDEAIREKRRDGTG